jgi:hypothetical protein
MSIAAHDDQVRTEGLALRQQDFVNRPPKVFDRSKLNIVAAPLKMPLDPGASNAPIQGSAVIDGHDR